MTPQFKILTGIKAYFDEEKGLCINMFYGRDVGYVREHWQEAETVYDKVFRSFITSWYSLYHRGEISLIPPLEWETLEVIDESL